MELSNNVLKFVAGVLLTIFGFMISHNLYFSENPLFGIPFFGQTLLAFALGAFGVLVLPAIIISIGKWFEAVVTKTVIDIWEQQMKKMQEQRKRKEEERDKGMADSSVVILDTSAIIDGRILDVVKTGFLDNPLVVPREVLEELQLISDNQDALKRQRGRRGLDIVKELKKITEVVIKEKDEGDKTNDGVDKALIKLCKKLNASLATVDFNLNKVASVSGIKVLNVNDLSNAIKAVVLPGEAMQLKVVAPGKDVTQGVGYLPDGTMVVVEGGNDLIGQEVSVIISRVIQTPAGKMFFAKKG